MVKVYKFYYFDLSGEMISALFKEEEDGYSWGEKHELQYFNHVTYYTSKEIAKDL